MRQMIKKCTNLLSDGGVVLWNSPNEDFYGKERFLEWCAGDEIIKTICYGHNADHLKSLFEEEGFKVRTIWGSYTPLKVFDHKSPRIIIDASL